MAKRGAGDEKAESESVEEPDRADVSADGAGADGAAACSAGGAETDSEALSSSGGS